MNCNNCMESLSAFIDGELTAEENAGMQAHIDECAECKELCGQLRELTKLAGELSEPVPEEFRGRWQGVLAEQRKPLGLNTRVLGSAAAAVLIIALVVGLYPTFVAPKNASAALEADVVAGIAPQAAEFVAAEETTETADAAEFAAAPAAAEETTETADAAEFAAAAGSADVPAAAEETAESAAEEVLETDDAAVSAEVSESAETAEAQIPAEQADGKTRTITREAGAQETPAENGAQEEAASADGLVQGFATQADIGVQADAEAETVTEEAVLADAAIEEAPLLEGSSAETAPKAAAADAQNGAAFFSVHADAMLEAEGVAEKADTAESTASASEDAAEMAAAEVAARAVPLNFIEKITIRTNGADIEKVREDWADLLISHGITGTESIGIAMAETLKDEMEALGYKLKYKETHIDMPFETIITDE